MLRGLLFTGALALVAVSWGARSTAADRPIPNGQRHYFESCGGCHGLDGGSQPSRVPVLKDQVGLFLCTPAGRAYIVRLPNVAFANMDDRSLADAMNFVVFGLGGTSRPADARPYTADEVAALRRSPLKHVAVTALREKIVADAVRSCGGGSATAYPVARAAPAYP